MKKIALLFFFVLTFISATGSLLFAEPAVIELMKKIDSIMEITSDARAKIEMTHQRVDQGIRKVEMIYYRRDSDDSFLIVMVAPESDKGNGYLRVGENFWMYRRNTRTFQHINRDENIGGTNARGQDFERRKLTELYEPAKGKDGKEIINEEKLGQIPVYKFEMIAKVNDVDYPKSIYWIRKDNFLPLKIQSYSLTGTLMQTAYMRKYTIIDERYIWIEMLVIDEFEKGNKTLVEISGISTKKLESYIFTKPYLENLSK